MFVYSCAMRLANLFFLHARAFFMRHIVAFPFTLHFAMQHCVAIAFPSRPSHHAFTLAFPLRPRPRPPFPPLPSIAPLPSPSYRALALALILAVPSHPRPHLPFPPSPSITPSPSPSYHALTLPLHPHPCFPIAPSLWDAIPFAFCSTSPSSL